MSNGIVFYLHGNDQTYHDQLIVAIYSLRKFYTGNIFVALSNLKLSDAIRKLFTKFSIAFGFDQTTETYGYKDRLNIIWAKKAFAHKNIYPYDVNIYCDVDRIFVNSFDETIFEHTKEHGLISSFDNKLEPQQEQTKKFMNKYLGDNNVVEDLFVADGGFVGAVKNNNTNLDKWLETTIIFSKSTFLQTRGEEYALINMAATGFCKILGDTWNTGRVGAIDSTQSSSVHFRLENPQKNERWQKEYKEACNALAIN